MRMGLKMNERISIDPQVCHGDPVIRGTNVLVAQIVGYLAGGKTVADVQKDFSLAIEDILAALDYEAEEEAHQEPCTRSQHEQIVREELRKQIAEREYE